MCFVDFKKACDCICRDKLWLTTTDMGYPLHLIDLMANLYRKQLAKVKVVEMAMRETLDGFQGEL